MKNNMAVGHMNGTPLFFIYVGEKTVINPNIFACELKQKGDPRMPKIFFNENDANKFICEHNEYVRINNSLEEFLEAIEDYRRYIKATY